MYNESTEFFHLIGLIGLFKTRLLIGFKYSNRHRDFSREKYMIQNSSSALARGAIWTRIKVTEIVCDKACFEKC